MSTTIDQKVVEMRFDNKQFESNVSTTMSTLDKLKQKLNLTGAAKGFEDIGRAANKVDMSGLGRGVEQVGLKFNAMYTIADQALRNITTRVQQTAENMVKALTIDPIKTGFEEYETQINATRTILANTSSKGSTIDDVNKALRELNDYADLTIYNFTEMTRNIGTFTAAGIDLDTSVNAIQGIANLAAVSGSTSQQASTAMYQLSQALASGTVKLMDWNSVVNAGMGGEMFQNALKETSRLLGTGADEAIKARGSFRESLREEWLTAEVLTETLKKFTTTGANEYIAEYTGLTQEAVAAEIKLAEETYGEANAIEEASKALAKKSGKNAEEIEQALQFAKNAEDAATKVKTFTQLWDVLKESAQSGWSQTWKLLVGDFEQAKNLLTPLADMLTGFIGKISDARNKVIESAFAKSFKNIFDNVKEAFGPIQKSADSIKEVVKSVEDYASVVDEIIRGNWGNGQERWDKLTEAGYDWAHAQNLVNEKLGCSVRHATDYKEAQNGVAESQEKVTEKTNDYILRLAKMTDEQLAAENLTDKQMQAFKELAAAAEKTGIPLDEFIKNIDQIDGRYLFINGFKNAGDALLDTFKAIGTAWKDIFPPKSTEEKAQALFDILAAFHKFTRGMADTIIVNGKFTDTGEKLVRTLKGIFAIVDVITTIVGGGFKIAFKVLTGILDYFNLDILDLTAYIGDALVKFRDWVDSLFDVSGILDVVVPALVDGGKAIKDWFSSIKESKGVQSLIGSIEKLFSAFASADFSNLSEIGDRIVAVFDKISNAVEKLTGIDLSSEGGSIFDGLIEGLSGGATKVVETIAQAASDLIDKFCEILDINSPSKVFIALGGFIITGLIAGITEGFTSVPDTLQELVDRTLEVIKNIDWSTVFAIGASVAGLLFLKKIGDALENFSAPFAGLGEIFESTAGVIESFGNVTKAMATKIKSEALRNLAITLAILVGCVLAVVKVADGDYKTMMKAVGVIFSLAIILGILAFAMGQLNKTSATFENGRLNIEGVRSGLLSIALAIGILALTVKLISTIPLKQAIGGFIGLGILMGAMLGFVYILQTVANGGLIDGFDRIGGMMIKLGIAMLLMVGICKLVNKLEPNEMIKGGIFAVAFTLFVKALVKTTKINRREQIAQLGGMLVKMAIAMALMIGVCKLAAKLEPSEALAGAAFALAFIGFIKLLVKATKIGTDQQIAKLSGLLLGVSISMGLMVGVCKLVGTLSAEDMKKGGIFALAFVAFVGILVQVTKIGTDQQIAKVGGTLIALSIAIGILALVAMMLSVLRVEALVKGITAVSVLSIMMSIMVKSLKGAQNVMPSLIVMTAAIAVMAIAAAALTMIPFEKLGPVMAGMTAMMGAFALMLGSLKKMKVNFKTMGTLVIMTAIVGALAFIVSKLSNSIGDPKAAIASAAALSILLATFAASIKILGKVGNISKSVSKNILPMFGVVAGLALILGLLGKLDVKTSASNIAGLSALMLTFSVSMVILGKAGRISTTVQKTMLPMLGVVAGLALILGLMSKLNINTSLETVAGLSALMLAFSISMVVLSGVGRISKSVSKMMLPMLGVVAGLGLILGLLTYFDVAPSIETIAGLSTMLLSFSAAILILSYVGPGIVMASAALKAMGILIAGLTVVLIALGGLSKIDGFNELIRDGGETLSLIGYALGNFIGSIIGGFGAGVSSGLPTIGKNIALFMAWLQVASVSASGIKSGSFDGVKEFIEVLTGVGLTSVGMSIADVFTNLLGGKGAIEKFKDDGVAFFEAFKEIAKAADGLVLPDGFSADALETLVSAIAAVGKISVGTTLTDLFLTKIGAKDTMEKFEEDGKAFFAAIKEIAKEMEGASLPDNFSLEGLTTLLDTLKTVAKSMTGISLADVFSKAVTDETTMEKFETDGVAFFKAIKAISAEMGDASLPDDFSIDGLTKLLDAFKEVGNRMIGLSIADIFAVGEDSETAMEKFKTDGVTFFQAIKAISAEMVGFELPKDFSKGSLTTLFETLKSVGDYTTDTFWADVFTLGGTTIERFQADGVGLFSALKTISDKAAGIQITSIDLARSAIAKIKEIIPTVNGIDYTGVSEFTGIGTGGFGADGPMNDIAVALKTFSEDAAAIQLGNIDIAKNAIAKIKAVITSLTGIDYSGVSEFTGIGTGGFGADGPMNDIATAIKDFGDTIDGVDMTAINTSITAANKIKRLITGLVGLDTSGIENFKAKKIGSAMKDYNSQVKGIDTSVVASSITAANRIKTFINGLVGLDTGGVYKFNPKPIGEKLNAYSNSVSSINAGAISNSINSANKLKNFINSLAGINTSGVGSFKNAVENLGKIQIGNLQKTFSGAVTDLTKVGANLIDGIGKGMRSRQNNLVSISTSLVKLLVNNVRKPMDTFRTTGAALMSKFASGIASKRAASVTAITSIIASTIGATRGYRTSFYSAGTYLADGFAAGISANAYKAAAKARAMANAAKKAAEEALGIASPSKVFYKIGDFTGQGFVKALSDYNDKSYSATSEMANYAKNGLRNALSNIQSIVDGELDAQPTIRPVLDLTNVRTGAAAIGGMFGNGVSIGTMAHVKTIGSMMSGRVQNGNEDVVSAINKLGASLATVGGDTYSIGDITYDDGSALADAMKAVVTAARIERRR